MATAQEIAEIYNAVTWQKFPEVLPPEKRIVLVLLEGCSQAVDLGVELKNGRTLMSTMPRCVVMGYLKFAAGDPSCPYFVTPGMAGPARRATHWCDCLPEEAQKPENWLPKEEADRRG